MPWRVSGFGKSLQILFYLLQFIETNLELTKNSFWKQGKKWIVDTYDNNNLRNDTLSLNSVSVKVAPLLF